MATLTPGYTFASGEVITPTKLNSLLNGATVSNIQTADIADSQISTPKIANGAITSAKLGSDIILVPAGAVMPFAMNSAPAGWLAANGAEYLKTGTYAALFAAIGTTFGETNGSGGAGTSHFRVPDLRGIFIRGASSQTISGITYSGTFATKQGDAFQGHRHTSFTLSGGAAFGTATPASYQSSANTGDPVTDGTNGTPRTASETRPANIALLYCIKF